MNVDALLEIFRAELGKFEGNKVEGYIPTGCDILDYAIANVENGGYPMGRIIEISGGEASGKSLLAYHAIANTQKMGGFCVYIDTERAGNQVFMERMGIDYKRLFQPKKIPSNIEEVFAFIEKIIVVARTHVKNNDIPVLIVWDSVAATVGKGDVETQHTDPYQMANEARAMSRGLRKIIEALDTGKITLICINQIREKIATMAFGDKTITAHGKALPFYASLRIKLQSVGQIKDTKTETTIGVNTRAKVFKNKIGPNFREVEFPLYYDWGIGNEISWLEFLKDSGYITGPAKGNKVLALPNGKEYEFRGSINAWTDLLKENPEISKAIPGIIKNHMIVSFERKPETIEIDTESLMEVEQLKEDLAGKY